MRAGLPPFERVVELHGPALRRFCIAHAGRDRGDDCFQEAMLAALRGYRDVRDPKAVRAWLFSIALRKVVDSRRDAARALRTAGDVESVAAAEAGAPDHDERLWTRVRQLPAKQRQAVTLRYTADLSHRDIAAIMATTEAAARRNVYEGVRRLRQELPR